MNFYNLKLSLFKILQKFLKKINIKIFYSRDKNLIKKINVDQVIDVGVAKGTRLLLDNFPNPKLRSKSQK